MSRVRQKVLEEDQSSGGTARMVVHSGASGVHREASVLTGKQPGESPGGGMAVTNRELLSRLVGSMRRRGRIVEITPAGAARTISFNAAMGRSKAAIEPLFRRLAVDLATRGIGVDMVCREWS